MSIGLAQELDPVRIECAVLAVWAGLIVGATIWPTLSEEDYLSILISRCASLAFWTGSRSFGVGGNLPVDGI